MIFDNNVLIKNGNKIGYESSIDVSKRYLLEKTNEQIVSFNANTNCISLKEIENFQIFSSLINWKIKTSNGAHISLCLGDKIYCKNKNKYLNFDEVNIWDSVLFYEPSTHKTTTVHIMCIEVEDKQTTGTTLELKNNKNGIIVDGFIIKPCLPIEVIK